ncbi:MAG: hypothetical protein VB062_01940 [Christensenella sp.]|nr:hypothetical protein [Christensenella sp.]
MRRMGYRNLPRAAAALLMAALLMGLSFAGTPATTVTVTNLTELAAAIADASSTSDTITINFTSGTVIDLGGGSMTVPSNVALNLSSGALRSSGGVIAVSGSVAGGVLELNGGTLIRESGSSITATISVGSGGEVRGPYILSLENAETIRAGSILTVSYVGESPSDTSSYVTSHDLSDVIYLQMTGSNNSVYKVVDQVTTSSGAVFRLGTKNTDTLSLVYPLRYSGLAGAKLASLNPTSYTESDAPIPLVNPTKDGFTFAGWICEALGVTVPNEKMVIPAGTSGDLTLTAVWAEGAMTGSMGGAGGASAAASGTGTTDDAKTAQSAASAADTAATTTKRVKQASSSTKVTFTSEAENALPTLESIQKPTSSFPWGWAFGGLGLLGIAAYALAKLVERKQNDRS